MIFKYYFSAVSIAEYRTSKFFLRQWISKKYRKMQNFIQLAHKYLGSYTTLWPILINTIQVASRIVKYVISFSEISNSRQKILIINFIIFYSRNIWNYNFQKELLKLSGDNLEFLNYYK